MTSLEDMLVEIATRSPEHWQRSLRSRITDETQVRHALIWLHANRSLLDQRHPDLGSERYQLEAVLDRGATATVWQAFDRKLGRNVAIKIFQADHTELVEILAEARAACEVVSDHVVRIHDVHAADPPYIVMELVGEHDPEDGRLVPGSSAAHCKPADLGEAVRWVRDVARGVHDAHLRNVFHRDLKPANVLIAPFSRRARIADFGLAIGESKPDAAIASGLLVTTPHGPARIVGTPAYMSPEQARGLPVALDPHDADERASLVRVDVWGLGAILCALATGKPPWLGEEPWELAASGRPPWVAERTPAGRRIPARLRRVIVRALAVDPRERYVTAADVADELDAYLACRPTSLDHDAATRVGLWTRRNPQLAISLAVAAMLGAMLVATVSSVVHLRDERALLEADRARLRGNIASARQELEDTEQVLRDKSAALADLRRAATDAQADYQAIITSKEKALRSAGRATRELATELANIRGERDTAETARDMYENFWQRTRGEVEALAQQLETAEVERDVARTERDRALEERDAARTARQKAETARDAAEAERARENAIRRRLELDLAKLAAELASLHTDG